MFRYLRIKREPERPVIDAGALSLDTLARDAASPISIRQLNRLPDNAKKRVYRALLPARLLIRYGIDPFTWQGPEGNGHIQLKAEPDTDRISLIAYTSATSDDSFFTLELADNEFNGVDLNFLLLNDPDSERFLTDIDETNTLTQFGTTRRNRAEEERAMQAGLAPGQVRASLGASREVLQLLEVFLSTLGFRSYRLEPLTYVSAWIFERRGLAYLRGHKLMEDIHEGFQPGGPLYAALDGSTPFRQAGQWQTVRGRAWAIQDGILETIGTKWDGLHMIKQIGRHAGVNTFPGGIY